jgi:hypothetical protein
MINYAMFYWYLTLRTTSPKNNSKKSDCQNMSSRRDHERRLQSEVPRLSRRSRESNPRFDASSLATVRELMKEIRRLEDEVL